MKKTLLVPTAAALAAVLIAGSAAGQATLYSQEGFRGRNTTIADSVDNLYMFGFNDRASSVVVERGRWEACETPGFGGRCVLLRPGQYASLDQMGMDDRISSIRRVRSKPSPYATVAPPPPPPRYDYYTRNGERLYQAEVLQVRTVVGPPEQRCWVERDYYAGRNDPNIAGAVIGGLIGGVLGHQIGGGSGRDVATAIGAIGGAAVGANVDSGGRYRTQDVQRCATVPGAATPAYYDVSYTFRGQQYRAQLAYPPGPVINVNDRGEPRA